MITPAIAGLAFDVELVDARIQRQAGSQAVHGASKAASFARAKLPVFWTPARHIVVMAVAL